MTPFLSVDTSYLLCVSEETAASIFGLSVVIILDSLTLKVILCYIVATRLELAFLCVRSLLAVNVTKFKV